MRWRRRSASWRRWCRRRRWVTSSRLPAPWRRCRPNRRISTRNCSAGWCSTRSRAIRTQAPASCASARLQSSDLILVASYCLTSVTLKVILSFDDLASGGKPRAMPAHRHPSTRSADQRAAAKADPPGLSGPPVTNMKKIGGLALLAFALFYGLALVPVANPSQKAVAALPAPEETFTRKVRPFFEEHCVACHGEASAKAGLRLDVLPADFAAADKARLWTRVLDRLEAGDMPPRKKPRPPQAEQG